MPINATGREAEDASAAPGRIAVTLGRLLAVLGFAIVCLGFHWWGEQAWVPILDSANLALHEAGHPLLGMLYGRAGVYGGTLFQLAFPLAACCYFASGGNASGAAAALVWLGENLLNVARYMADARAQELPLLGNGDHDWAEIFGRWGLTHLDARIAGVTHGIGVLLMLGAIVWLYRRWRAERSAAASPAKLASP